MNIRKAAAIISTAVLAVSSQASAQSPNPAFDEVAAKLDKGGTYFHYSRTENVFSDWIDRLEPALSAMGGKDQSPGMGMIAPIARSVVSSLGLDQITDYGRSVYPLSNGMARTKTFLGLKQQAGIFSILGSQPRELAGMKLVPTNAVVAVDSNVQLGELVSVAQNIATSIGGAAGEAFLQKWITQFRESSGLDIEEISSSLGDEIVYYISLDPEKTVSIVGGQKRIIMPAPAFGIALNTKDTKLFDAARAQVLKHAKTQAQEQTTTSGMKMVTVQGPPNPLNFAPAIGQSGNWFLLASNPDELQQMASGTRASLASNAEFAELRKAFPPRVNSVTYVSPKFSETFASVLKQIEEASPKAGNVKSMRATLAASGLPQKAMLAVRVNEPKGILWASVSDEKSASAAIGGTSVAAAGVLAAVAVPAFLRARENSRGRACQENLAKLDGAKEQYALEYKLSNNASITMEQLVQPAGAKPGQGYLKTTPRCPAGGEYTLNNIGTDPTCSIGANTGAFEKHVLP